MRLLGTFSLLLCSVAGISAEPITYEISGLANGSFLGSGGSLVDLGDFNNAPFKFQINSDTSLPSETPSSTPSYLTLLGQPHELLEQGWFLFLGAPGRNEPGIAFFDGPGDDVIQMTSPLLAGYDGTTAIGPVAADQAYVNSQGMSAAGLKTNAQFLSVQGLPIVYFTSVSDVTFDAYLDPMVTATPEPATWLLGAVAFIAFICAKRSRRVC